MTTQLRPLLLLLLLPCPSLNLASDPEREKEVNKVARFKSSTAIDITLLDNIHTLFSFLRRIHTLWYWRRQNINNKRNGRFINTHTEQPFCRPPLLYWQRYFEAAAGALYWAVYIIVIMRLRLLLCRVMRLKKKKKAWKLVRQQFAFGSSQMETNSHREWWPNSDTATLNVYDTTP